MNLKPFMSSHDDSKIIQILYFGFKTLQIYPNPLCIYCLKISFKILKCTKKWVRTFNFVQLRGKTFNSKQIKLKI